MSYKKINKIQELRGLAIIAVVMIHTCPLGTFQVFYRPFINFSVAMFLFISGYLTDYNCSDWKTLINRRIKRVLIPYVIWTIIYTFPDYSLKKITFNMLSAKGAMTLYYIFVYIQLVLLTPLLSKLARKNYSWLGWTFLPLIIYTIKTFTPSGSLQGWFWKTSFLCWYPYYYIGLLLGNKRLEKLTSNKVLFISAVGLFFSIILQIIEGYWMLKSGMKNPGTQLKITSLITSMLCIFLAYRYIISSNKLRTILLEKVGDYSFGVFLSHILIIRFLRCFEFYDSLPFLINTILVLSLSLILVSALCKMFNGKLCKWIGLQ